MLTKNLFKITNQQIFILVFVLVAGLHFLMVFGNFFKAPIVTQNKPKIYKVILNKVVVKKSVIKPKIKPKKKIQGVKKIKKKLVIEKKINHSPKSIERPFEKPTINPVTIKDLYKSEISRMIQENLIYPAVAKRVNLEGVVIVSFIILSNGTILTIKILKTDADILSKAVTQTIKSIVFKPIPNELNLSQMEIIIPIGFTLK